MKKFAVLAVVLSSIVLAGCATPPPAKGRMCAMHDKPSCCCKTMMKK